MNTTQDGRPLALWQRILYRVLFCIWYTISILPMWVHYINSYFLSVLLYSVFRYRRRMVRKNLCNAFPLMKARKRWKIEREFYLHMSDLMAESIKFFSISRKEIMHRMQFHGVELIEQSCRNGKSCAVYLGHYANWEWISSLQLWIDPEVGKCVQLYHPLENRVFDSLINYTRTRFGSTNIPAKESMRHMIKYRQEGKPLIIGFIADQVPLYENIHYWTEFLNQETPVFTGGERIAKKMDMDVYYMDVVRTRRGHYECTFVPVTTTPKDCPDNELTQIYCDRLEETIKRAPQYWLWSHNRWKRNRKEWIRLKEEAETRKRNKAPLKEISN